MIAQSRDCAIVSKSTPWDEDRYPEWAKLRLFRNTPNQKTGHGVEPHYHDCDEFWLFVSGEGEAWLDGESFPVSPNTLVYTPMGTLHRFQMFTDFTTVDAVSRHEGLKRRTHIRVDQHGPPVPTVPGFWVAGARNAGPFRDRGARCPVSELRVTTLAANSEDLAPVTVTEYWLPLQGTIQLTVGDLTAELFEGDVAMLRAGTTRRLRSREGAQVALARE
jgi:mannose-6-phosphate isomerase-like protein (cupin superfamily)